MQAEVEMTVLVLVHAVQRPPALLSSTVLPAVLPCRRETDSYESRPLENKYDEKIGLLFFTMSVLAVF